ETGLSTCPDPDAGARARAGPTTWPRRPSRHSPRPEAPSAARLLLSLHAAWLAARLLRRRRCRAVAVLSRFLRRRTRGAFRAGRWRDLGNQPPRDQPLPHRPQVRGHPVEDEPGRET